MRKFRMRAVASLALTSALVLAACGGSDSSDGGGASTTAGGAATTSADTAGGGESTTAPATSGDGTATTAAGGGGTDGEKPLIYVLYKQGTQQYFIDQANGAKAEGEALGADVQVVNVEESGDKAITEVQNAIAAGAAGIGITVPDQQIGPRVAELASQAGIPLIATDDVIEDQNGNPVPFAGFNGTEMGKKVGEEAARLLVESGWVDAGESVGMLSIEKQDLSVCNQRTDAEKAAVTEQGGLPADKVYPVASDASIDGALSTTSPVITAHPDVTHWVVTGCNDESVQGALQALAAAGIQPDNIIGVGLGAYEACKDWAADRPSGFKAALYISGEDVGRTAVKALYDAIVNGVALPAESIAPTSIVDPSNWSDSMQCT